MKEIKVSAKAKINLALDVIRKREDGYHDLRMIMQTIDLEDRLLLRKIVADKVVLKTNLYFLPTDERNLVVKIAKYMRRYYQLGAGLFINLYKKIPVGAGLGGGSADGAAVIKGINQLFELDLSMEEMMAIGKRFGADIPYCLFGGTALAEGIGDQLTEIASKLPMYILVVKPRVAVSTRYVYETLEITEKQNHPDVEGMIEAIESENLQGVAARLANVLEAVTGKKYPEVLKIKKALLEKGAVGALMSGSGSAVFALFSNQESMEAAAREMKNKEEVDVIFEAHSCKKDSHSK